VLDPYAAYRPVAPYRVYDEAWRARWAERLGTDDTRQLAARLVGTRDCEPVGVDEEGRLYYLSTDNPNARFDGCAIGGRWCGTWHGDEPACRFGDCDSQPEERWECNFCRVADLQPDWFCDVVVTPEGGWHDWTELTDAAAWGAKHSAVWRAERAAILARYPDHAVVLFDMHY
jgi:hypothetical protein